MIEPQKHHYLQAELYEQFQVDSHLLEFLEMGSLDGLWYWDLENPEHEWLSPRFWQVLGYDPDTKPHLASAWQDLIHPDDLQTALENLQRHKEDPDCLYDQVVRYFHQDGTTVWVRCRGIMIRDEEGRAIRMLGAHTDLTPLKKTEAKLRQRSRELESANQMLRQTLSGILSTCSSCRKVRDEGGRWVNLETYVAQHSGAQFSHGLCRHCFVTLYPDMEYQGD